MTGDKGLIEKKWQEWLEGYGWTALENTPRLQTMKYTFYCGAFAVIAALMEEKALRKGTVEEFIEEVSREVVKADAVMSMHFHQRASEQD